MKNVLVLILLLSSSICLSQDHVVSLGAAVNGHGNPSGMIDAGIINRRNTIYKIEYCRNFGTNTDGINTYAKNTYNLGVVQKSRTTFFTIYLGACEKLYANNLEKRKISANIAFDFGTISRRNNAFISLYISLNNGVGLKTGLYFR